MADPKHSTEKQIYLPNPTLQVLPNKVRSNGEVELFIVRTVENQKFLSLAHLQNSSAGCVGVIIIDDT